LALCPGGRYSAQTPSVPGIPDHLVKEATAVKERHEKELFRLPAVVGAGVGASSRKPGKAAILLYVSRKLTKKERRSFPKELEGVPVEIYESGLIEARPKASRSRRR
jgi:hypothetical protein